ncbi:hypothetical protein ACRAWF_16835 [Streptomyces sp. L7]
MRSRAGVFIGNLLFAALCCCTGPIFLAIGYSAWNEDPGWGWPAAVAAAGAAITLTIPVSAISSTRKEFPGITRRDRLKGGGFPYRDDTFVLLAPRAQQGSAQARLTRADVLEASLVRYNPDGESTFTTHVGNYTPDEFTPLIGLRLRVYDTEETEDTHGTGDFEVTGEWRVPSVCLSAITAGRLVVLVEPGAPGARRTVTPDWPRSALLAGTRTARLIDLEGRTAELTRRSDRQLQQMRISRDVGGVVMTGDTIDPAAAGPVHGGTLRSPGRPVPSLPRGAGAGERAGRGHTLAGRSTPGSGRRVRTGRPSLVAARWGVGARPVPGDARQDHLPGPRPGPRHGSAHPTGGRHTAVRRRPAADGADELSDRPPPDQGGRPRRQRERPLVRGRLGPHQPPCGCHRGQVIAPDGRELPVAGRPELIWALMNLLTSQGLSVTTPVLDLRKRRLSRVTDMVTRAVREHADPRTCA